jgi:hypothetical protein
MVLNFHDFKQQFASRLMTTLPYQQEQYTVGGCFYQGVDDALKIIAELYDSGKIVLTFKTAPKIGINNISDYAQDCVVNDDVEMDELEYPLLTRYYYSGVKQILDILNHNFNVKYHG